LADDYEIPLPERFSSIVFWVLQHPDQGRQIHAFLRPEEAELLDQLETDVGKILFVSHPVSTKETGQVTFSSAHLVPFLADLVGEKEGQNTTLFADQHRLRRPDYRGILKSITLASSGSPALQGESLIKAVGSVGLELDQVRKEEDGVSATWSQGAKGPR
jgi:hypothetical protein